MSMINETDLYQLKKNAIAYYSKNDVQKKIEEVLNKMFFDQPVDIFGYMTNFFNQFSLPAVISQIDARIVLDTSSIPTLETNVYCIVNNHKKLVASCVSSNYWELHDNSKPDDVIRHIHELKASTEAAVNIINDTINDSITDMQPVNQSTIDQTIRKIMNEVSPPPEEEVVEKEVPIPSAEKHDKKSGKKGRKTPQILLPPDTPRPLLTPGCVCLPAVSQAVCMAGANTAGEFLYDHIARLHGGAPLDEYELPQPIITLMHAGKVSSGKLKCLKEVAILPRPDMPISEVLRHVADIHQHLLNSLLTKFGNIVQNAAQNGALLSYYEKTEQCLDAVQDAITAQDLAPGQDFSIIVNCAGHEILDMEKGKYEIGTGTLKSADELVEYWADLTNRYPAIIGLIDPFRKEEVTQWRDLALKVSERCFVIGDFAIPGASRVLDEGLDACVPTNAAVLRLNRMNTVSDVINCADYLREKRIEPIIATCRGETINSFIVDLAVGLGIRFVKIGAPSRGENVSKLTRLLSVESSLMTSQKLRHFSAYNFQQITSPVVEEVSQAEP